jgi:hypothetical protein
VHAHLLAKSASCSKQFIPHLCAEVMDEDKDMPNWAKTFKRDMNTQLRRLSDQVRELQENARVDMAQLKTSVRLAYCRPGRAHYLAHNADACASLLACRDVSDSSMMSISEIVADYVVNKRGDELVGEFGGDCQAAARAAEIFFSSRKLMQTSFQECVLYSPSGQSIAMSDRILEAVTPALGGKVRAGMKAYKLIDGSCVWTPEDVQTPVNEGAMGYKHYVATVMTLDNVRIAVDWGIGQFSDLPEDMRLYF